MFTRLRAALRTIDRNERNFWLGLLLLFVGLSGSASVFAACAVVGAAMAIESVITSYLAAWLNAKGK